MMSSYGDCIYCGGKIEEKRERLDYRYHGQLFIVENVPLGVCNQCGEKVLTATVTKLLEKMVSSPQRTLKLVSVPVISLA